MESNNAESSPGINSWTINFSLYPGYESFENIREEDLLYGIKSEYLEDGEKCNDSYECQFDSFCNRHNNTCQKLFSVENGENIEICEKK